MIRAHLLMIVMYVIGAPVRAEASRYTLKELLDKLSRESPTVVAARSTVAMRRSQLLEQQLRWLPEGESGFGARGAPDVHCIPDANDCGTTNVVDLLRGDPGTSVFDRGPWSGPALSWGLSLRQPLFTSMKIESAIGSVKGGIGVAEADLKTAELDVALNAVRVFTQIKTARGEAATLETAHGVVINFLNNVQRELDGKNRGRYTESDQIRLRMLEASIRGQIVDQLRYQHSAEEALKAMTADPEADVDESELEWEDHPIGDQASWRALMLNDRPEVLYGHAGLRYYDNWRRLQLGWALPDVALITSLGWGYSPTFSGANLGYVNQPFSALGGGLGFGMRQPLDLGPKILRFLAMDREREQQRTRFKLGLMWWTLEVDKAWLDLEEARRRLTENLRGERLTQGWYMAVDANLALGLAPDGRELVEVVLSWSGFRGRRLQAVADTLVAMAALRRLSGQPILEGGKL